MLGKPELKKLSKSTGLSTRRFFFPEEEEGVWDWREVAMKGAPYGLSLSVCHEWGKSKDTRKLHDLCCKEDLLHYPNPKEYLREVTLHQSLQIPGEVSLTP